MEIKCNTYEELVKKYPIGSIISEQKVINTQEMFCPDDKGMLILTKQFDKVERYNDLYCICTKTTSNKLFVRGYLYDGEFWYPAYSTWDGWIPYDENNVFKEDTRIINSVNYNYLGDSTSGF